jgi:predicted nucleic acid-binding protein
VVKPLFDTNILIDFLNGIDAAADEIQRYEESAISVVTWMEVMVGAVPATAAVTETFLSQFRMIGLDETIARLATALRRDHRIKLPDAIIWASAKAEGRLLVSRNERDFPADDPGVRIPYRI